jgi:hypothetical protein
MGRLKALFQNPLSRALLSCFVDCEGLYCVQIKGNTVSETKVFVILTLSIKSGDL